MIKSHTKRMSCYLPIASALRDPFLKPIKLTVPVSARSDDDIAVVGKGIKIHRHVLTSECNYDEWLGLSSLVTNETFKSGLENEALILPINREMNSDRILFGSFTFAITSAVCTRTKFRIYILWA